MNSSNAFYKTSNSGYGTKWQASGTVDNPVKLDGTPQYHEIGQRDLALNTSLKTYKHRLLAEMREKGELDTQVYGKIRADKEAIKKQDVVAKAFPSEAERMNYPKGALRSDNPLYGTSGGDYGKVQPSSHDLPNKYFPKSNAFTA